MRKLFIFITTILVSAMLTHPVSAGVMLNALSVRLEDPKTPTNQNTFDVVFVALDLQKRDVTVTCWKQGPSDSDFVQFGGAQTFPGGGNTGVCPITSSIFTTKGDYTIKAIAKAGIDEKSDSAMVTYNNEGPGDPTNYSKERANLCDYKIKFRSADDSGKTVKVEVYRSENTSFTADSGSRVDTISLGSNTDGTSITTPPDCNKEYYFGVRAFDSAGNGSNVIGDSIVTFTTTTTTTTSTVASQQPTQGAIEVLSGEGTILGKETESSTEGTILGETTPSADVQKPGQPIQLFLKNNGILIGGIILLIAGTIGLYVSKKKN